MPHPPFLPNTVAKMSEIRGLPHSAQQSENREKLSAAAVFSAVGQNLGRSLALSTWAKRAVFRARDLDTLPNEIRRALGTIRGYDHPPARDRVSAKLRQIFLPAFG